MIQDLDSDKLMYPETSTLNSHDLNPFSPIVKIEALEEEEQRMEDQLSEEQLQLSQEQDMKLSEQLEQSEQLIKEEGEQRGKSVDLFAASEVHQGKLYRI